MQLYTESTVLVYEDGLKYRLASPFVYKLYYDYEPEKEFKHPQGYYELKKDEHGEWWIFAHYGCCWDGPSGYWDFKFMQFPSLIHDILHWLIGWGAIDEKYNDTIDDELEHAIRVAKTRIPIWLGGKLLKNVRARIVRRATNFVDEKYQPFKKTDRKRHEVRI